MKGGATNVTPIATSNTPASVQKHTHASDVSSTIQLFGGYARQGRGIFPCRAEINDQYIDCQNE